MGQIKLSVTFFLATSTATVALPAASPSVSSILTNLQSRLSGTHNPYQQLPDDPADRDTGTLSSNRNKNV